jgi:hypothetical protein
MPFFFELASFAFHRLIHQRVVSVDAKKHRRKQQIRVLLVSLLPNFLEKYEQYTEEGRLALN